MDFCNHPDSKDFFFVEEYKMLENFMMVALFVLGLYLLITSVMAFVKGDTRPQTIVYIAIGAVLVAYNLRVVNKLFSK